MTQTQGACVHACQRVPRPVSCVASGPSRCVASPNKKGGRKGGKNNGLISIFISNRWTLEFHTPFFKTPFLCWQVAGVPLEMRGGSLPPRLLCGRRPLEMRGGSLPPPHLACGQFSKVQSGKMGPAPGRFAFSKGMLK